MASSTQPTVNRAGGVGFSGLLGILFIALKLTHAIDWSWWWVLLPIYGPIAVGLALLVIFVLAGVVFRER